MKHKEKFAEVIIFKKTFVLIQDPAVQVCNLNEPFVVERCRAFGITNVWLCEAKDVKCTPGDVVILYYSNLVTCLVVSIHLCNYQFVISLNNITLIRITVLFLFVVFKLSFFTD